MKKLLLSLLFCVSSLCFAQIQLKGSIQDSELNPLEMANVVAINQQTKSIDSYGFSDAFGTYKLNLKSNQSYLIKASFVGMKTKEIPIVTKDKTIQKNIILELDTTLDEVEIVAKMPVRIQGDTIIYNADSFKSGTEKKLQDVLKKMPGIEVNDDGEVKVQGKKVKKVMVEGKSFFDGDTKLATKNIPANVVDKIEVLKNHSEVSQLKNVTDNEDNTVLNIKLKEGKKNFWFGDVTGGLGVANSEERYLFNPKLFYYSPKASVSLLGNRNNLGKAPFTFKDYFKFTGSFPSLNNSATQFSDDNAGLESLIIPNEKVKAITTNFGAVNFNYAPTTAFDISGFGVFSGNNTAIAERSDRVYMNSLALNSEEAIHNSLQKNNLGLFNLKAIYKSNERTQLNYVFFGKFSNSNKQQGLLSIRDFKEKDTETVPIQSEISQQTYTIKQALQGYYTFNDTHILTIESHLKWSRQNPFYQAMLSQFNFQEQLGFLKRPEYQIAQEKLLKTNQFDTQLNHYYRLNPTNHLQLQLGGSFQKQQFTSNLFDEFSSIKNNIQNDVFYNVQDYYAGLYYKFVTGMFTFSQGVQAHYYDVYNFQNEITTRERFWKFLPELSLKIHLKKSESIRLSYQQKIDFTDVAKLTSSYILNNYVSLFKGNPQLGHSLSHQFAMNYVNFNMFNYTDWYGGVSYTINERPIVNSFSISDIAQNSKPLQSGETATTATGYVSFTKNFRKFKWNLKSNLSFSKQEQILQFDNTLIAQPISSLGQGYSTKLSSKFTNAPNFDIGYSVQIDNYKQGSVFNTFIRHTPYASFDTFITKELTFNTKYTYTNYSNSSQTLNSYSFWNAELGYQPKNSNWQMNLEVSNLLNVKTINQNFQSNTFVSNTLFEVQPRFVVLSATYSL